MDEEKLLEDFRDQVLEGRGGAKRLLPKYHVEEHGLPQT